MLAHHLPLPDVAERARAALLSIAVGDALGATLEFMTPSEIKTQYGQLSEIRGGGWLHLPRGAVTDDTEMTLCIARSIAEVGWSPRDIAERFVAWLRSRPRDVGGTCRRGIRRYIVDGSLEAPFNEADAGNGAVMRIAPVAVAALANGTTLARWATEQAHLTHHHPLSDAACIVVGRLIQLACLGQSKAQLRRYVDAAVKRWPQFGFVGQVPYCSAYVVDTMRTVLWSFFSTRTFEQCLVLAVNQGGDSDTAGAIVGAIAGAYYGREGIPRRWLAALDPAISRELGQLGGHLVSISPMATGDCAVGWGRWDPPDGGGDPPTVTDHPPLPTPPIPRQAPG